ncbi:MAG: helical backbone metal receptor [Bacteroidota bacterium]
MFFTDQMNRNITLEKVPQRIISLVPSQTEFLYDLGLDERVVGITKFCIYPENWYKSKNRVGGTKNVDFEKVRALNPDLIIGNKEENTEADILELEKIAPVWMSDIYTMEDSFQMMESLGEICDLEEKANYLIDEIKANFLNYKAIPDKKTAMYLIWNEPLMAAAKNTFIDEIMQKFGFVNFYQNQERYPICVPNEENYPDYILLSSEPFPFKEEHKIEIQKKYPKSKIIFVDGEIFSWYGSRLRFAPAYFEELKKKL